MTKDISINKSMLPFSWLYGLGVWFRNKCFEWGIFRMEEFPVPVISIGNITVGGTGKTPHVEYLIEILNKKYKIAVLSRGYKRKTSKFIIADEHAESSTIGDEPYQIFKKYPDIIVAVDKNRRDGIRKLLNLPEEKIPQVILLDDAYQHRYVKPSLSILLVDNNRMIFEDALLPAGRLREPASEKSRADIIIVTKCPMGYKSIDYRIISKHLGLFPYQSLFFTSVRYGNLLPVFNDMNREQTFDQLKKNTDTVLLLAGIASPKQLISEIKQHVNHVETLIYPDHHHFSSKDIIRITKVFNKIKTNRKIIITTEKDAARLVTHHDMSNEIKDVIFYLPIKITFDLDQENLFKQKIIEHVETFKRNRFLD